MKTIFYLVIPFTTLVLIGCSKDDSEGITSLGLTTQDFVGTWKAEESREWYGGDVGYDKTITWEISDTQIKESIYQVSWNFNEDGIIDEFEGTVSYTYNTKRNEISVNEKLFRIYSFSESEMVLRYDYVETSETVGFSQLEFYRSNQ